MKRMVNVRLLDFFDQIETLPSLQCGGRAQLTFVDHILSLEAAVRKAQPNSEQIVSIFYLEKAHYLTRGHGILMDLNETGTEGKMFFSIQNRLKFRSFKVKVNKILSGTKIQTEGTPLGSVLSPAFRILKINKLVAQLPYDIRYIISLNMVDL